MKKVDTKVKVAALSIASNTTLIILKVIAGIISGSVSIISEAIHSGMDLIASLVAFFSVKASSKPADENHPYGHGKIENVSGIIEGILIFIAAALIITEAVKKIFNPAEVEETTIAIIVMVFSGLVNAVVSNVLYKVAKKEDSIALEADALHLKTDVYTSLGVGAGLILIQVTKISILDPIVAIMVACLIISEAWHLCRDAFSPLLDASLPKDEEEKIKEVLDKYDGKIIDYHSLRTRKVGSLRYIDFHMTVDEELTVRQAHDLSDEIENDIEDTLKNTNVQVHIEPGIREVTE